MQREIFKEDYFGTLMSVLVDECRRILPTFNPTQEAHKIQNDMCKAGTWIDKMPAGTIVHNEPQQLITKYNKTCCPNTEGLPLN